MMNFIPIFPLEVVVFPGEALNLHIFEPRYKELIQECIAQKREFGIPFVRNAQIADLGTIMEVTELVKTYDSGEMDIRTQGQRVFQILEVVRTIPEKKYSGAIVRYPENDMDHGDTNLARLIAAEVRRLHALLNAVDKLPQDEFAIRSYDIAHFIGLSREQEFELLGIFSEIQRLEYIRRHLYQILPTIKKLEEMKSRIQRNGHFQELSLKDLDL